MTLERRLPQDIRVLLLESIHPDASAFLSKEGYQVETLDRALGEDELVARLAEVDVIGIRSNTHMPAVALGSAPHLLAVGAFCIGTNQIDLPAATARGIAVFNAPFSNTRSVVELVIGEIISLQRGLTDKSRQMHEGKWQKSAKGSHEIRGRRLGIVGYGNIGSQLSVLAEGLGMSVYFYDTDDKLALGNAKRCASLEELLEAVEVVTLHVDGRPANRGMFGEAELSRMRAGSFFLNLSRGFVVDHEALRAHIESGHLAGASVDVFPKEPKRKDDPFVSELRGLPNVILTPHVGGSTEEAQQDIGRFVAGKLHDYLAHGATSLSVNLPNLVLPPRAGEFRLTHVHSNVPGVLAAVNSVFASHGMNIESQFLATKGDVGYVITDTPSDFPPEVTRVLAEMPSTVRLRIL
ncbi:MAG: phosphoglycerate dehydrogenase [Acidimicrobiales bacterium]